MACHSRIPDVSSTEKFLFFLLALCLYVTSSSRASSTPKSNATLDSSTVKMLSNILDSLDAFRNDRLRDLDKIRLEGGNVTMGGGNSSVAEHIKTLRDNIMGQHPVKKSFGYKVTVYTSPIEEDGKDGKPVLVTQYVGGDMKPTSPDRPPPLPPADLEQSADMQHPELVHTSGSAHVPFKVTVGGHKAGGLDHSRKTEQHAVVEQGHKRGHHDRAKHEHGHDRESHSSKKGEHHREADKEAHRHDEQSHDKGGASQQGIRERTEIEYYEREHFLDTEYDKAKAGHEKSSGVKEHESQDGHDNHDLKRIHSKKNSHATAVAEAQTEQLRPSHYSPPYGGHASHGVGKGEAHKEQGASSHFQSEESKGERGHHNERAHQEHQEDKGFEDKDKGRRKEGYRERGYKITAEREYFLNDAHHDTGHSAHTSGQKSREREGEAHASKDGERDRGFTKEEKSHDSHDAAYDKKERHYEDGEKHEEGFAEGEKKHRAPEVVYVPSVVEEKSVLAHPPLYTADDGEGVEDDYDDESEPIGKVPPSNQGYEGHATYKHPSTPGLQSNIRHTVRDAGLRDAYSEVRSAPLPSYGGQQNTDPVRFPGHDGRGITQYGSHLETPPPPPPHRYADPHKRYTGGNGARYLRVPPSGDGSRVVYQTPVYGPTAYHAPYPEVAAHQQEYRHSSLNPGARGGQKTAYSPVVLLTRGPIDKKLDVWYTHHPQ